MRGFYIFTIITSLCLLSTTGKVYAQEEDVLGEIDQYLKQTRKKSFLDRSGRGQRSTDKTLGYTPGSIQATEGPGVLPQFGGRYRKTIKDLYNRRKSNPGDAELDYQLGEAFFRMGRSDSAIHYANEMLDKTPEDNRGWDLLDRIHLGTRPVGTIDLQHANQSNKIYLNTYTIAAHARNWNGMTGFGFHYQMYEFIPYSEIQSEELSIHRPGVTFNHRFNNWLGFASTAHLDIVRPEGSNEYNTLTFDSRFSIFPSDYFRFHIIGARKTFDNIVSLERRISAYSAGGSIDIAPAERLILSGTYTVSDFSDGNILHYRTLNGEAVIIDKSIRLSIGPRYNNLDFLTQKDNGYFNPDMYHNIMGWAHFGGDIKDLIYYDLEGSYGREFIEPGSDDAIYGYAIRLGYSLSTNLSAEINYTDNHSSLASSAGYPRRIVGGFIRYRF